MDDLNVDFMRLAIELAKKGVPYVAPNPLVGAVVVKDGKILGRAYHARYGDLHAERLALLDCKKNNYSAEGASMYVTLEPCCHYGKQPPCTEALIEAKLAKVIVGSSDPNPLVSGKGLAILRAAGIEVVKGFLQEECDALNAVFFYFIRNKLPYVAAKYAMCLDGKIATKEGFSKWISGKEAREYVYHLRTKYTAIMVGSGTVLADDPELTAHGKGRNPIRIICDSGLKTALDSKLVKTARDIRTIFAYAQADDKRVAAFEKAACELLKVPKSETHINLQELMKVLAAKNIDSIFVEGGGTLHYSLFSDKLVQKVYAFIAPKIFGGVSAKTAVEGAGLSNVEDAFRLQDICVQKFGEDFLLEGEVKK